MAAQILGIRDYPSALAFLFGRINYERSRAVPYRSRRFKLDRMRQLVARLGNPERAYPAIHIAGTKGKGSTASMVASVLGCAGYCTGLYTSPHLHCLEERFVVAGQRCTSDDLVSLLARIEPIVVGMDAEARRRGEAQGPTYFEITTAAALLHFQQLQVDCAVVEVGLGGRLDSTNICQPAVSVISSISFDHTRQLGKTLASIAREKAGIIKPGTPVITGVTQAEPLGVIRQVAAENGCPIVALGTDFDFEYRSGACRAANLPIPISNTLDYREWVTGPPSDLKQLAIGLHGRHQAANASVAIAALQQLQRDGWHVDESAIRRGIAAAHCPARIEVVGYRPAIVLDAAHNPASVAALIDTLPELFPTDLRILVFASSLDKDVPGMLQLLLPHFEHVILTRYLNNPRSLDPTEMASMCRRILATDQARVPQLHMTSNPREAWQVVERLATPSHLICVAGSFFLAAEIRPFIKLQPV